MLLLRICQRIQNLSKLVQLGGFLSTSLGKLAGLLIKIGILLAIFFFLFFWSLATMAISEAVKHQFKKPGGRFLCSVIRKFRYFRCGSRICIWQGSKL